jgi:AcrR family transcriptional regulator
MVRSPRPSRRPVARRQQLIDAAAWTFARKGYRAAGVGDIVNRAKVARGTFYLYFDSKEQVFLAILEDFHERIKRMVDEPEGSVPLAEHRGPAMLQRSLRRWLELFAAHRDAAAVILKEATSIDPRFEAGAARLRQLGLNYFAERFRRFQALGLVNRSVSPGLVARLQMAMVEELVNAFVLPDESVDIDDLAGQLATFEWNGIRPGTRNLELGTRDWGPGTRD